MKLLAFAASHRKQSVNRKLAQLAAGMAKGNAVTIDFVEYSAFDVAAYDDETYNDQALPEPVVRFIAHLKAAHGIILASPEYNWSFPGSLKNIIDWASALSPNPFAGKTALLLSASPSRRGGAQGLIQLKVPLEALGGFVFPRVFTLSCANEAFAENGTFRDAKLTAELGQLVNDFFAMTSALMAA